jgi:uncharacterized protein YkwD
MSMKIRLLVALLCLGGAARADQAADEILASLQTRIEQGKEIDSLCDSLRSQPAATLAALERAADRAWPGVRDAYLERLEEVAKRGVGGDRNDRRRRIRELREDFMEVYGLGEDEMKPLLRKTSMPALEELRTLLDPAPAEVIAAGADELREARERARTIAVFRDAVLDAAISTTPADSEESLAAAEKEVAAEAGDLPRDGLRTLEENREIAEKEELPADEAEGIEEANRWRLYVGLDALELDPALCAAGRDHSKDMSTLGFFAHESPVDGKRTPSDRAGNFGTSGGAENIYMGGTDPGSANRGWFFSPGHHKNLFRAGHRRIGLGRHGGHWTQMFGR